MASSSTSLYNVEIESHALAALLQYPDTFADFGLVVQSDWSEIHQQLWDVISHQLSQVPVASVSPMVLSERLKGFGITSLKNVDMNVYDYLEGLRLRFVEKSEANGLARELKRLSVRRGLANRADAIKRELVAKPNLTFDEMTVLVEKELSSVTTQYYKPEVTDMFANLIDVIEDRGNQPLTAESAGYLGPFPSINLTIGPLTYHGSYTVIGARTNVGKSSLGWFYQTYLAEKYQLPLLHLDEAEMTVEELQWRAVCALSGGKIPYWAVFRGEWRKHKEWTRMIRDDLWPRVRKMTQVGLYYKNVGSLSPHETISFMRRFYHNKVGNGRFLLIHHDYLKGKEAGSGRQQEHQVMGSFVGDEKTLITEEILASIWTSVQNNRSGTFGGNKKAEEINDDTDVFGLSDRIIQQSTHGFTMRFKTPAQLAYEKNLFGSLQLSPLKKRQLLGERYKEMLTPVKMPSGQFKANYYNLDTEGFSYRDCGSLRDMMQVLGDGSVDMSGDKAAVPHPI